MDKPASLSSSFELFRRIARRLGVPARHAEDVAQDALLRGLEADRRIEPGGDPAAYRVAIAANQARDHVRRARRRGEVLTSFDQSEQSEIRAELPDPEELLRGRQRHVRVRSLIDRVDPKDRHLLIRHDLEEIPLAQVAAELGLTTEAVKTQHRRALERLREEKLRWIAEEHARGRDGDACVPLAFGWHRRESWPTTLRRLALRIIVQGSLVVLTGTLVAEVSPRLEPWLLPAAIRAPGTMPVRQEGGALAQEGGTSSATAPVAPAAREISTSTYTTDARADAAVDQPPAPPIATARRASTSGSAARSTVSEREWNLIRDARSALDAHNAIADLEARRLLEVHAREFPRGRLTREREALLRQIR
ncbi:RNA polymerase subunit sigma [Sorangium cellulosum]|uniref:RNA polymerase subunit sigma n=1 Tax=Sorangium cellulosum TaxID=56 RepID=A0A150TIJ0_SORCE|nr:RNA polymerase subunit sigma [Sorangium cellulosum]